MCCWRCRVCCADHLHPVGPAQQTRHRQQHMRHQAGPAPGTTRPKTTDAADHPPPGVPPRGQAAPARTEQLTSPKTPLDLNNIATYHDHGALQAPSTGPPVRPREREGRCASQNVIRLSSHTSKGLPEGSPCDHHRGQRRPTTAPSSDGVPFNTHHRRLCCPSGSISTTAASDTVPASAHFPARHRL